MPKPMPPNAKVLYNNREERERKVLPAAHFFPNGNVMIRRRWPRITIATMATVTVTTSLLSGRLNHLTLTLAFGTAMERHLIQKVALDPNSTIASNVGKIWHNRADFSICVSVKEGSKVRDVPTHPWLVESLENQ